MLRVGEVRSRRTRSCQAANKVAGGTFNIAVTFEASGEHGLAIAHPHFITSPTTTGKPLLVRRYMRNSKIDNIDFWASAQSICGNRTDALTKRYSHKSREPRRAGEHNPVRWEEVNRWSNA
jgi:hypothetical protein